MQYIMPSNVNVGHDMFLYNYICIYIHNCIHCLQYQISSDSCRRISLQLKWWLSTFVLYGMLVVVQEKWNTHLSLSLESQLRKEIGIIFR